jgi:signal transduction histidine kinase/CheY-like chemotaxis protein
MLDWIRSRISVRQTVYVLSVVVVLATAISAVEALIEYQDARARFTASMNQWLGSVADTSSRAAYHVDPLQADAALHGLMKFRSIAYAAIKTDLGVTLAERRRDAPSSVTDAVAVWLFGDLAQQQRPLVFDLATLQPGATTSSSADAKQMVVGSIQLRASPELIGAEFIGALGGRIAALVLEFLLLAAGLTFIFHRTLTRSLLSYADDLSRIDLQQGSVQRAAIPEDHELDELGLVVSRTNELLERLSAQSVQIHEQREALIHRERVAALGSMLAGVAHELNNPLAILIAQAELLTETATDEAGRQRADKILRPARRCARIVRTFLALARHREVKKSYVVLEDLVSDVLELLNYQFRTRNVEVFVDFADGTAPVWADDAQLSQALINLLMNAYQAVVDAPGGGRIRVKVAHENGKTQISVSDNGPGIPAEIQSRIFEPFFTTRSAAGGTGLGLSYCLSVVESHGGTLKVDDSSETGTTITVTLPEAADRESVPSVVPDGALPSPPLRVLVVDDESELLDAVCESLGKLGHSAVGVTSGESALKRLRSEAFDLVLSDLRMPGMDGPELYESACRLVPQLQHRFVFITGDSLTNRVTRFLERVGLPQVNKPFDTAAIRSVIAAYEPIDRETGTETGIPSA